MDSLVLPTVEQAVKSINASCGKDPKSVCFDPDQKHFSRKADGLQMTVSSRLNSNIDSSKIDEIRAKTIVEEGELSVIEKNCDWQTHTHYNAKWTIYENKELPIVSDFWQFGVKRVWQSVD